VRRSTAALAVGTVALAGAWLFGSVALAPVGLALLAVGLAARAWRRASGSTLRLERHVATPRLVEGDALEVELRLFGRFASWLPATAHEQLGRLGTHEISIRRGRGSVRIEDAPRGRHVLGPAEVALEDPLGLEKVEITAPAEGAVIVRPRLVRVETLFTDAGRDGFGARRASLRRPAGVDLHSVRDYQQGEPLRLVHWPTTARRGALTVRELQDAPRDETVVVLDCHAAGAVGPPGRSSFDDAVRAAAAIVHAAARRGRPVALVAGSVASTVRVSAAPGSWEAALDVLAAAEPSGRSSLEAVLADRSLATARAPELVLVTCRQDAAGVAALQGRNAGGVVLVDAPTYAGAAPSSPSTTLLRLAAAGVPVVVVRCGDDLATVLGGAISGVRTA
jgi:uncharacterized protein (DUF58 family)